jgi:hypothetical protein
LIKNLIKIEIIYSYVSKYARNLIEVILDLTISLNSAVKISDVNETINITGINRNSLIGCDYFNNLINPQKVKAVYQYAVVNGCVTDAPLTLHRKNGKLTIFHNKITPF